MQALYAFTFAEIPMQLPQTASFITKPQSPVFAEPNTTAEFVWKMNNCILNSDWQVKVVTKDHDLYPLPLLPQGPIRNIMHLSMYCPRYPPTGNGWGFDQYEIKCPSPGANIVIKCPH